MANQVLNKLRKLALAFPEAVETSSFGHPTFRVRGKSFAILEPYHGEQAICFKATPEDQALLLLDPQYYEAPYIGKHGWTSMRVESFPLDWKEVEELLRTSYRLVAPKGLVKALDEAPTPDRGSRRTAKK